MAQLPPKVPTMTTQNWPSSFPFQMMPFPSSSTTPTTTTTAAASHWVGEFLDFSSARRNSHRRSVSDPIAFIEAPNLLEECRASNAHAIIPCNNNNNNGFEKLDDEQLRTMFSDDVSGLVPNPTMSSSNPSTPSDQNSENDEKNNIGAAAAAAPDEQSLQPKTEPGELDSSSKPQFQTQPSSTIPFSNDNSISDPKRIKRILANRQSAQRSRVRKLQYISELERSVTTLQTEVSALSPRVAFLDHQRLILNVDNSTLKQRIAALAQDKLFKDAHQEALRKEIERLRQIYHEQNMKKMGNKGTNETAHQPQPIPLSNFNKNGSTYQE